MPWRPVASVVLLSLLLVGCSDDSGASDDFVEGFDRESMAAYVADGTLPDGVDAPESAPEDRPGRIGWLLSAVTWPEDERDTVLVGVRAAVEGDPAVLDDLLTGVAARERGLTPEMGGAVYSALRDEQPSVRASLAGVPASGEARALDPDAVLGALAAAGGSEDSDEFRFTQGYDDVVVEGLDADLALAADAAAGWPAALMAAEDAWIRPGVLADGAIAHDACAGDAEAQACRDRVDDLAEGLAGRVRAVVYSAIPVELLPEALRSGSGGRVDPESTVPGARDEVDSLLDSLGIDVLADVQEAAARPPAA